eukprot:364342-Chlamydomonas_euryale.AAC.1
MINRSSFDRSRVTNSEALPGAAAEAGSGNAMPNTPQAPSNAAAAAVAAARPHGAWVSRAVWAAVRPLRA